MSTYIINEHEEYLLYDCGNDILNTYDSITYNNIEIPISYITPIYNCPSLKGISSERALYLIQKTYENNIILSPLSAKKLLKAEHKGKADSFFEKYKICGLTKCSGFGKNKVIAELTKLFQAEKRFKGRIPQITPQIAVVCSEYNIPLQVAVEKFSIQDIRKLLELGLPKVETVLLYTLLSESQLSKVSNNLYIAQMVSSLLEKGYRKQKDEFLNAALWIADHAETDIKLLEKVYNKASELVLNNSVTVDNVRVQFGDKKAINEVEKIEKAYKKCGFKLKNCVCELQRSTSRTDRYKAEILEGNDPKQVMLGYDTDCCQHLGEAGESAMMHGLLHPKAGFWVATKNDSKKVVAQAEVWELNYNTLVFDNIEFANDAEIDQYKEIIGKWVSESEYENIIMGCGYNEFMNDSFKEAGAVIPPVTPYELYVLSYEDECDAREEICELSSPEEAERLMESGEITYFDYVYCDSERESVYLKENGRIAEFFDIEQPELEEDMERD